MALDAQRLFEELKNTVCTSDYVPQGLSLVETRIQAALREVCDVIGPGIYSKAVIPYPLAEFCLRLQIVINQFERITPLSDLQMVAINQETWATIMLEFPQEIAALITECGVDGE